MSSSSSSSSLAVSADAVPISRKGEWELKITIISAGLKVTYSLEGADQISAASWAALFEKGDRTVAFPGLSKIQTGGDLITFKAGLVPEEGVSSVASIEAPRSQALLAIAGAITKARSENLRFAP